MKRLIVLAIGFCLLASFGSRTLAAGAGQAAQSSAPAAQSTDKTPPSYDMKAQAAFDLADLQKKFTSLAEAIPAEKYSWRPEPGVRSINELFLHVAAAGINYPGAMGVTAPTGFDAKNFEKSTTDKAKIIEWLNKSFTFAITAVNGMSNADFAKPLPKLGPDANEGDVVYLMVVHAHEHLGQSIAYARANGIVPPWTAAAAKKNPQAAQE
jgi:uncharacterized damage-inducible protein DinB